MAHDADRLRPECAANFGKVETAVGGFTDAVKEFRRQGLKTAERLTAVEASSKSAWHELRNDVIPDLKKIPGQVSDTLNLHMDQCPAYANAMDRARRGGRGHQSTAPRRTETSGDGVLGTNPAILKWILYVDLAIGGVVAGVGATLGYWEIQPAEAKQEKPAKKP